MHKVLIFSLIHFSEIRGKKNGIDIHTFMTFIHLIDNLHSNLHSCLSMRREGTTPWDILSNYTGSI